MQANRLDVSYLISGPANWRGTYRSNNRHWDNSWSWYKDGDPRLINFPHFTLAFNLRHEVNAADEWVGFHISVPIALGAANARFNYVIANNTVQFSNMTRAGLQPEHLILADNIAGAQYRDLDDLATSFYNAAISSVEDTEMLTGVAALFR